MVVIKSMSEISARYDTFFLDMCGVLIFTQKPIPGASECLRALKKEGKQIILITNAPNGSDALRDSLRDYYLPDVDDLLDKIVTGGDMLADKVAEADMKLPAKVFFWGNHAYVPGQDMTSHIRENTAMFQTVESPEDADLVVCFKVAAEICEQADYILDEADRRFLEFLKSRNIPLFVPNADIVAPNGDNRVSIVSGFFAHMYAEMGGPAITMGKPGTAIFERAYKLAGFPTKEKIVMVGDTLEADILGGNAFGIDTVLLRGGNFGGKNSFARHELGNIKPTWIADKFSY
ncbi:MAG: TIGR01459 family HAD-type hydrolase [Alphaproteobacteria bacterium]|nr:TIGR01459 family HAD-type hydrolase [Alphaproteobacteria bacterium]